MFKMREMHRIIKIAVIFMILGCWGGQGIACSADNLRVPMGIAQDRAVAAILAIDGGSKGQTEKLKEDELGPYQSTDWFSSMQSDILRLKKVLVDDKNAWLDQPQIIGEEKYLVYSDKESVKIIELVSGKEFTVGELKSSLFGARYAISPDEHWLVVQRDKGVIRIDLSKLLTGKYVAEPLISVPSEGIHRMVFSVNGEYLSICVTGQESLSEGNGGQVSFYPFTRMITIDFRNRREIKRWDIDLDPASENNIVFLNKTDLAVSDGRDVVIWDVLSGQKVKDFRELTEYPVISLAVDKYRSRMAITDGKNIIILNLNNGIGFKLPAKYQHGDTIMDVMFHSDQKRLISTGQDGTLRVWDVNKRKLLTLNNTRSEQLLSAYVWGHTVAVAGSVGQALTLWDLIEGEDSEQVIQDNIHIVVENQRRLLMKILPRMNQIRESLEHVIQKPVVANSSDRSKIDYRLLLGNMEKLYRQTQQMMSTPTEAYDFRELMSWSLIFEFEWEGLKDFIQDLSHNTPEEVAWFASQLRHFSTRVERLGPFERWHYRFYREKDFIFTVLKDVNWDPLFLRYNHSIKEFFEGKNETAKSKVYLNILSRDSL